MHNPRTFYVRNFGCRATQADGAGLEAELTARGLEAGGTASAADVVIVNTCTVTHQADQDARQTIRRIHRENPGAEILVTGCYAQRRPDELSAIDGVKWVVGNSHKSAIGEIVAPRLVRIASERATQGPAFHGEIRDGGVLVGENFEQVSRLAAQVVDAGRDRSRPNLKIQDGCNNRCGFCIIPSVRGQSRSAEAESVLSSMRRLARHYPEVVLTGINVGRWGRDLDSRPRLVALLRRVLDETDIRKLRLSSIEPMDWTNDLLDLAASSDRVAKHVHIPMQSGSDAVLKAMRRRYRARHYADRVERARRLMPEAAIGADVMVGFPGETDEDFAATRRLVADLPFTYLHVFTYSARPDTEAHEMPGHIAPPVKKERNRILRELAAEKNLAFRRSLVGKRFEAVTLEQADRTAGFALTDNYVTVELDTARRGGAELIDVEIGVVDEQSTKARELRSNVGLTELVAVSA